MGLDLQEDGTRTEKCELTSGLKAELSLPDERDREIEESSVKVVAHIEATHTFTRSPHRSCQHARSDEGSRLAHDCIHDTAV